MNNRAVAMITAGVLTAGLMAYTAVAPRPQLQSPNFDNRGIGRMVTWDAQEILTLARGHNVGWETGYRVHRVLPIILVWLLAAGQDAAMPWALLLITFAGALLLARQVSELLPERRKWMAGFVVLLPPLAIVTMHLNPADLGLGLALWGWRTNNKWLLLAAGFVHETLLAFALVRKQVLPIASWVGWAVIAAFIWKPITYGSFGLLSILHTQPWDQPGLHYLLVLLTLIFGILALRTDRWLAGIYLAFVIIMGPAMNHYWDGFAHVLAPLWVLGFITIAYRFTHQNIDKGRLHAR